MNHCVEVQGLGDHRPGGIRLYMLYNSEVEI